jgi:hypothetical protein
MAHAALTPRQGHRGNFSARPSALAPLRLREVGPGPERGPDFSVLNRSMWTGGPGPLLLSLCPRTATRRRRGDAVEAAWRTRRAMLCVIRSGPMGRRPRRERRSTVFLRGYAGPIATSLAGGPEAFMFGCTTQRSPADSSLAHKESAASRLFSPTRTRVQTGGAPGLRVVFSTIGL